MPIPESQLETWGHQPQTQTAVSAHETIRESIRRGTLWIVDYEDYLQGSYANDTNIYHDHDVDIVVQLNQTFRYDLSNLSEPARSLCEVAIEPAVYTLDEFRTKVLGILIKRFGYARVDPGDKAVKVLGEPGVQLDADVVICQQYRRYTSFSGDLSVGFDEGIAFYDLGSGRLIVNYPKLHLKNGVRKHNETSQWFKPTVRVFKNARNRMILEGYLDEDGAPSYFLQGLLYNVPSGEFGFNDRQNFQDVLEWLEENERLYPTFLSQNGIVPLFGSTPEQWDLAEARAFVTAMRDFDDAWAR